jgi:hypothetical protein
MRFDKLLTYFITIVFILSNSIGVIIVYNQIKFYHKRTIKEQIKQNNFQEVTETLSFSKSDLKNKLVNLEFIEEYEFRYNGKLYDIITQWETDDSIYYKCINDTKEEELEEIFVNYVVNNNHRNDLPLPIKQLLNSLQVEYYLVSNQKIYPQLNSSFITCSEYKNPLDEFLSIPDPPPRFVI